MRSGPLLRTLTRRTSRLLAGLLLLIGAIFIAESFTSLMADVLRNDGSVISLALLLLYKLPEIVDFALPIALTIGVFFAVSGARDENELVICAAAGVPWTAVPHFALIVGGIGFAVSLLFSAFVLPTSSYLIRLAYYDLELSSISAKIESDEPTSFVRDIGGRTVIATPSDAPGAQRGNLFLFQDLGEGRWQFDQADDWTVTKEDPELGFEVALRGFRTYSGAPEGVPPPTSELTGGLTIGAAQIFVSNLNVNIRREQVIPVFNRERRAHERLFWRNVGESLNLQSFFTEPNRGLGESLARAILCIFAAVTAVAGATFARTGVGRLAGLPLTVVVVLAFDIVTRSAAGNAATSGPVVFWSLIAAIALVAVVAPLAYLASQRETIIVPSRGRA